MLGLLICTITLSLHCLSEGKTLLVSGAGDIKLTKDANVLLHEMQIQHPAASLIAKVATAQDDITGDGTTANVLIIGELLKQADLYISEAVVDSVLAVRRSGYPIDLLMVEIIEMKQKSETDTKKNTIQA
ncbi:T-complex protein 1 subunit zeta [Heterocephalus glaber]|uniref:T-complex protein 1 subunit zeta n=1 Tax=Heterocephalus glaber TaxID=10181 RepID=A0AAX6S3I5_HETGA|nr:T-complex protein 1 subunit zeta [Heterocephalus glaber]